MCRNRLQLHRDEDRRLPRSGGVKVGVLSTTEETTSCTGAAAPLQLVVIPPSLSQGDSQARYLLECLVHPCIWERCAVGHYNLQSFADCVSHGTIERLPLYGRSQIHRREACRSRCRFTSAHDVRPPIPCRAQSGCTKYARICAASCAGSSSGSASALD